MLPYGEVHPYGRNPDQFPSSMASKHTIDIRLAEQHHKYNPVICSYYTTYRYSKHEEHDTDVRLVRMTLVYTALTLVHVKDH